MRLSKTAIIAAGSVGAGAVALAAAHVFGAFDRPPRTARKSGGQPKPKDDLPSPDDLPLEPWEEEAELIGPTHGQMSDVPVEPHETAVGRGHPSAYVVPLPNVEDNPGTPQLGGSSDKPYEVIDPLHHPEFAPEDRGVEFAPLGSDTTWPVLSNRSNRLVTSYLSASGWQGYSGRAFKARRETDEGELRMHAGVDLFGREGDLVVAPEDGTILTILPFHHGTWAVYLRTDDGRILNLGEVEKYSWREFDVEPGKSVRRGDPLTRIGKQTSGSTMIHFETYDGVGASDEEMIDMIRNGEFRWTDPDAPPDRLYDPTAYLLTTASRTYVEEHGLQDPKDNES